jgi:hypothetical protein
MGVESDTMKVDPSIYEIAGEWALYVRALAMGESQEDTNPTGPNEGGRARGLLQIHPANFIDHYTVTNKHFPASVTDTWEQADIKCCASFLDTYIPSIGLDKTIVAWNKGLNAVMHEGEWNQEYLDRFTENLNKLRGIKNGG